MSASDRRVGVTFGVLNAVSALVLWSGLLVVEPRFWALDLPLATIGVVEMVAALALLCKLSWARRALAISAWLGFVLGLLVVSLIVLTMVYLRGIHGDYGLAALAVSGLIIALLVPYTLVLPALELLWLKQQQDRPVP